MTIALETQLPHRPRLHPGCERQGYETLAEEGAYWIDTAQVTGEIPADIRGTLFLTCVGRNSIGGQQFVCGRIGNGDRCGLRARSRFWRQLERRREIAADMGKGIGVQVAHDQLRVGGPVEEAVGELARDLAREGCIAARAAADEENGGHGNTFRRGLSFALEWELPGR